MGKKITCVITFLMLLSLSALLAGGSLAQGVGAASEPALLMDTYEGPTVNLSGRVIYPDFKEGQQITITVKNSPGISIAEGRIAVATLSEPGDYSVRVPQNTKGIYIIATVLKPGSMGFGEDDYKWGIYSDTPLEVQDADIKDIDFIISRGILMSAYQGPALSVSGRVIFPDYKEGQRIFVTARSHEYIGPPDIAILQMTAPGEYSIKIPQNIGNVYIRALAVDPSKTVPRENLVGGGSYINNPVKVGDYDIEGVDLTIKDVERPGA